MSLQKRIILEYRTKFPRQTLREVSAQTQIQLTRVFRLFNGAAMKLEEYERFHQLVYGKRDVQAGQHRFYRVSEELVRQCNDAQLAQVTALLERQLRWSELIDRAPATSSVQVTA